LAASMPPMPEGVDVDFETVREEWNEYKLKDGTTLKVKLILAGVMRSEKQYLPNGDPVYFVTSQNVVRAINVPKELKRKPGSPKTPTV